MKKVLAYLFSVTNSPYGSEETKPQAIYPKMATFLDQYCMGCHDADNEKERSI